MKIPEYFKKWFNQHGFGLALDNWTPMTTYELLAVKRIAWRAYRRGRKDALKRIKAKKQP